MESDKNKIIGEMECLSQPDGSAKFQISKLVTSLCFLYYFILDKQLKFEKFR